MIVIVSSRIIDLITQRTAAHWGAVPTGPRAAADMGPTSQVAVRGLERGWRGPPHVCSGTQFRLASK